jgi:pimeloyl-ACP methyl ester carboxylesterase
MAVFVVAHGAWTGGWFWKKLRPLLQAGGHAVFTPTCTGVGERAHLAHPGIDLDHHINDVLQLLQFEDLNEVVLVGHSYGGMVATGVADRAPERIAQLVYIDAFVPRDGDSAWSLVPAEHRQRMQAATDAGDGWRLPPNPMPPDSSAADVAWAVPRRLPQPIKTFTQPIVLTGAVDRLPRSYVYCSRPGPGDGFRPFAERAQREPGWRYAELDASHNPQVTMPDTLARLLVEMAAQAPAVPPTSAPAV